MFRNNGRSECLRHNYEQAILPHGPSSRSGGGISAGPVRPRPGRGFRDGGICILAEFAFPDGDDGPGEGVEALGVEFVAGDVAGYLFFPESGVRLGFDVLGATAVAVPEAAVDEDDGAVLGQDEVGGAGEALVIEPVPVALVPQCVPDGPLWACVPGTDAGHVVGTLRGSCHFTIKPRQQKQGY